MRTVRTQNFGPIGAGVTIKGISIAIGLGTMNDIRLFVAGQVMVRQSDPHLRKAMTASTFRFSTYAGQQRG